MPILKAVLDTSVMVSVAFAKEGVAKNLKNQIANDAFILVTSKPILKELYEVLHYPHILKRFKPSKKDIDEFIGLLIEHSIIVEGAYSIHDITEDPKDDMFIACALEGNADYIVSRDPHLHHLRKPSASRSPPRGSPKKQNRRLKEKSILLNRRQL